MITLTHLIILAVGFVGGCGFMSLRGRPIEVAAPTPTITYLPKPSRRVLRARRRDLRASLNDRLN